MSVLHFWITFIWISCIHAHYINTHIHSGWKLQSLQYTLYFTLYFTHIYILYDHKRHISQSGYGCYIFFRLPVEIIAPAFCHVYRHSTDAQFTSLIFVLVIYILRFVYGRITFGCFGNGWKRILKNQ